MPIALHGDFRSFRLEQKADLVLTDPPYNIGMDYGPVSDSLSHAQYRDLIIDFANWARDNTVDDSHLAVIHYPEFFLRHFQIFESAGWQYSQSIRWIYNSNFAAKKNRFQKSSREILCFTRGEPYFNGLADPNQYKDYKDKRIQEMIARGSPGTVPPDWFYYDLQKGQGDTWAGYKNQLPYDLVKRLILSMTQPGELVADPFAGTGRVLHVARDFGRKTFGCDLNPNAPSVQGSLA